MNHEIRCRGQIVYAKFQPESEPEDCYYIYADSEGSEILDPEAIADLEKLTEQFQWEDWEEWQIGRAEDAYERYLDNY